MGTVVHIPIGEVDAFVSPTSPFDAKTPPLCQANERTNECHKNDNVLILTPRGIFKRLIRVTRNAVDQLEFSAVEVLIIHDGEAFATVVEGDGGVGP